MLPVALRSLLAGNREVQPWDRHRPLSGDLMLLGSFNVFFWGGGVAPMDVPHLYFCKLSKYYKDTISLQGIFTAKEPKSTFMYYYFPLKLCVRNLNIHFC